MQRVTNTFNTNYITPSRTQHNCYCIAYTRGCRRDNFFKRIKICQLNHNT